MAGAASVAPLKSDPPTHNLLRTKNGLDNQDHFRLQKAKILLIACLLAIEKRLEKLATHSAPAVAAAPNGAP